MTELIITGFERALLGFSDGNGIATGQQSTLANGATSGAYVVQLPRTGSFEPLAPVNLNIEGGDIIYTTVQYGNSKTQPFDMILSSYDQTLVTLISGSALDTTNSLATVSSDNPRRSSPRIMWLGLQSRAQDMNGVQYYVTKFFPKVQVRIKRKGPAYQALSDVVINCTPQMANLDIQGKVFGTTGRNMNLTNDQTDNYDYWSANPIHVVSFRQDAAATTFNTVYKPISTVVTLHATVNAFSVNAVDTALSALTLAGVATLAAAGSAGAGDVLIHETNYVPV